MDTLSYAYLLGETRPLKETRRARLVAGCGGVRSTRRAGSTTTTSSRARSAGTCPPMSSLNSRTPPTTASPTRSTGAGRTRSPAAAVKASASSAPSQAAESFPSRPSRQAPRASDRRQNVRSSAGAHGGSGLRQVKRGPKSQSAASDFNDAVLEEAFSAARSQIQRQDEEALRRTRNPSRAPKRSRSLNCRF